MAELSAEDIAQRAFGLELLDDRAFREVREEIASCHLSAEEFRKFALRRNLLTPYQMERLFRGDRSGFFYGKYKALYQVGAGTFARVYRAVHRDTQQVAAVKVLRQRFATDAWKRDQFCQEGEVGLTLRHPNIVAIYEVGNEKGTPYIGMEFVEGQNLREFMKVRKRIPTGDAVRLMADIARGLDHAARRGISHRDMKASNVLVSSTGQAKLVDFGLAGVDPDASDDTLAEIDNPQTIDYVALERGTGVRKDDIRSDIYFAGCIFYHMLSGVPPLEETRDRIRRADRSRFHNVVPLRERAPDVAPQLAVVVERAMELDPRSRYQAPGTMLADLTAIQDRLSSGEGLDSAAPPVAGSSGRQRVLMIVEANAKLQDTLRDHFKRVGYRVLVTSDPLRPLEWFAGGMFPADCVLFSTGDLGEQALAAFNEFGSQAETAKVPAVLLLGSKHQDWVAQAKLSPHRVTVMSPIKAQELRDVMARLLAEPNAAAPARG